MRLLRLRRIVIRIFVNFILCPFGFALDVIRRKESAAILFTAATLIFIVYSPALATATTPFSKWFYPQEALYSAGEKNRAKAIFASYMVHNYPTLPDIIAAYACVASESTFLGGRYTPTKFYCKIFGLFKNCLSMAIIILYLCPWEVHIPGWGGWVVWFTQNFYNLFLNIAICKFWTCSNDLRIYILTEEWNDTGYPRPFLLRSMVVVRIVLFVSGSAIFLLGFNFMIFLLMLMFVIGGFYLCAFSFILPFCLIFATTQTLILAYYWLRRWANRAYMRISGSHSLFLYPSTLQRLRGYNQPQNNMGGPHSPPIDDQEEDFYRLMDYDQEANGGAIEVHEHLRSEKSFMEGIQVIAMWVGYPLLMMSSMMLLESNWKDLQAFLFEPPFLGFNVFVVQGNGILATERARMIAIILALI